MKKIFSLLTLFFILIFSLNARIVTVGYILDESVLNNSEKSVKKQGYFYEYLQKLSSVNDWQYSYVYGTLPDLLRKLENGQIDLLPSVSRTPDNLEKYFFSELPMNSESFMLFVLSENSDYSDSIFDILNGKSVGVRSFTADEFILRKWMKDSGINLEIVPFDSETECYDALQNGSIFSLIDSEISLRKPGVPIRKIGDDFTYFAVNRVNNELLDELNTGMNIINTINPHFNSELWVKYCSSQISSSELVGPEREWLKQHKVIKVGCMEDDFPFSYKNEKKEPDGYLMDLMEYTRERFAFTENQFEYIFFESYQQMVESLLRGELDVVFPVYMNLELAEEKKLILSDSVYSVDMSYVCNDSKRFIHNSVAIPYTSLAPSYMEDYYPNTKTVLYDTRKACLDAVLDEKCTGTIFNTFKVNNYFHKRARYRTLQIVNIPDACEIGFGTTKNNAVLLDILNRGIVTVPNELKTQSISTHILANSKYTFAEFVSDYIHVFIVILIVILLLVLFLIISLDKLVLYMNYDSLTRLLNRRTLDSYMNEAKTRAEDKNEPFSVLMLDIDDFKKVNDVYGHACGDEVLKVVAKSLMHSVSDRDHIFRWGGEEILVLVRADKDIAVKVAERISHGIEALRIQYKDADIKITSTIGVASYKKGMNIKDLFEEADANMYKGKNSGKNKVVAD